jgi:hypothetical protein
VRARVMSKAHSTKCSFPGCDRPFYAKEVCHSHYAQLLKGNPLSPLHATTRPDRTPPRILFDEVPCPNPELDGPCHIFKGSKNKKGYGQVSFGKKMVRVHRYVWERDLGPIHEGAMIDHQCRNRACCNVQHLRVVTAKVNATENVVGSAAQIQRAKTHCPSGHEYTQDNLYMRKNGHRECRTCTQNRCREYARRKASAKRTQCEL